MTENDSPEPLEATQEQLVEAGRLIFDTPEFRDALKGALNDHADLFLALRGGRKLTSTEELRFGELNEYILATNRILERYNQPKTDQ